MKNISIALCAVAAGGALLAGCGSSATLMQRDGMQVHGTILGVDSENYYLEPSRGRVVTVPRDTVRDIDHPGNVAAAIGGGVAAYGVVNIAVGAPNCKREGDAYCVGVFTPLAVGLPIMLYGIGTYVGSTNALQNHYGDTASMDWNVVPQLSLADDETTAGASVVGRF